MSAFRKLSSIYVLSYFPFGFEGRIWDLIVSVPDHCLSFYFTGTCLVRVRCFLIVSSIAPAKIAYFTELVGPGGWGVVSILDRVDGCLNLTDSSIIISGPVMCSVGNPIATMTSQAVYFLSTS